MSAVSFADHQFIGELMVEYLGRTTDPEQLRPSDYADFRLALAERYSPARLSKTVTVTRMILKWAYESEHIEETPRFGPDFSVASKATKRIHKANQGGTRSTSGTCMPPCCTSSGTTMSGSRANTRASTSASLAFSRHAWSRRFCPRETLRHGSMSGAGPVRLAANCHPIRTTALPWRNGCPWWCLVCGPG